MADGTVWIENDFLPLLLKAWNEIDEEEALRVDGDRRLMIRSYSELIAQDPDGNDIQLFAEAAGQLGVSLYGWDGSALQRLLLEADQTLRQQHVLWDPNAGPAAPIRWRGETAGEATVALYGEDAGGTIDRLVVNPIAVTSTPASQDRRPVEAVAVPAAVADIWAPGLTSSEYMDVVFEVVNVDGTNDAVLEDFGVDYGNDAGAIDRYFGREIAFPAGEVGQHFGPHRIWGDDAIMAEANFANRLEVHVYIVEEGTAL
jgi:hypothetical protein